MPDAVVSDKPFLRWAGGKNWLVKSLFDLIGDLEFRAYHEPFLGGGSVFLRWLQRMPIYLMRMQI